LLGAVTWANAADTTLRFPTSPVDPTTEDCARMMQEFNAMTRALHKTNNECLSGDPHIGPGVECSLLSRKVRNTTRAWPQCGHIDVQLCQVYARRDTEEARCKDRARSRAMKQTKEETERAKRIKITMDQYEKAESAYEDARHLMADPREFILQKGAAEIARALFPQGREKSADDRYDLAEEVYRIAFKTGYAGIGTTRNRVIRAFQRSSFDNLRYHALELQKQQDTLFTEMEQISLRDMQLLGSRSRSPAPVSTQIRSIGDPECTVLSDPARSEQLLAADSVRWLALVERCQ
jgi:hypothetical protein